MTIIYTLLLAFTGLVFISMLLLDVRGLLGTKGRTTKGRPGFKPRALVIVPCRGTDLTLANNLRSLAMQDYGNYDMVAVVDSKNDVAVPTLRKEGIDFLVCGNPRGSSSGKVHAILHAIGHTRLQEVIVIADSDITAGKRWLSGLVAPLADESIGISTTFPFFNPVGGFWSRVKMVWGFVGEGMMGSEFTRFGWGGSLAFRRGLIDKDFLHMATDSPYAISDDICVTRAARERGLGIAYAKDAQPTVNSAENFGAFWEWANRQTALSRMGYPATSWFGIAYYSAEILLMLSGVALSAFASPLFAVYLLHAARGSMRDASRARVHRAFSAVMSPFMPFIYMANLISASRMREITWRGRQYSLRR